MSRGALNLYSHVEENLTLIGMKTFFYYPQQVDLGSTSVLNRCRVDESLQKLIINLLRF